MVRRCNGVHTHLRLSSCTPDTLTGKWHRQAYADETGRPKLCWNRNYIYTVARGACAHTWLIVCANDVRLIEGRASNACIACVIPSTTATLHIPLLSYELPRCTRHPVPSRVQTLWLFNVFVVFKLRDFMCGIANVRTWQECVRIVLKYVRIVTVL